MEYYNIFKRFQHAQTQCKETKNFEKRFNKMLTRIDNLERNISELTILNIYVPNKGAPRYTRQVLNDLQRGLDSHIIILGDFNTTLSVLDRSTRQKINKDIQDLNSDLK